MANIHLSKPPVLFKWDVALTRFVLCLTAVLTLISCGGGGSNGGTGSVGGTGLSEAQRIKIVSAINSRLATLPEDSNGMVASAKIVASLTGISGIQDVELESDGSVTMQFSDGIPYTIFNEGFPLATAQAAAQQEVKSIRSPGLQGQGVPRVATRSTSSLIDYPASGAVDLEDAAPYYNTAGVDLEIINHFEVASGYPLPQSGDGSLERLRVLGKATPLGVFCLFGEGGVAHANFGHNQNFEYGVTTSDVYGVNTSEADVSDLMQSYVSLGSVEIAKNKFQTVYVILPGFITHYWQFSPRSVVFAANCLGASALAADFRNALFQQHCSVFVGWASPIGLSCSAINFLTDRMLGTDDLLPEPDPTLERPLDIYTAIDALSGWSPFAGRALPQVLQNPNDSDVNFYALEPTISSAILVSTSSTLNLGGLFGAPGGSDTTVIVNGAHASGVSVGGDSLTCTVPSPVQPGQKVPVTVLVNTDDGRVLRSNTITATAINFSG